MGYPLYIVVQEKTKDAGEVLVVDYYIGRLGCPEIKYIRQGGGFDQHIFAEIFFRHWDVEACDELLDLVTGPNSLNDQPML